MDITEGKKISVRENMWLSVDVALNGADEMRQNNAEKQNAF